MAYQCEICKKVLKTKKSLKRHMETQHPQKPEDDSIIQTFEIKAPKKPGGEATHTLENTGFHCIGCGGEIAKGQNPCPHCGAELDWKAVE